MKRFILLVVIIAIAFTACSKKSETATIVTADRYAKILNGDLSDFAGTWVNAEGHKTQLSSNGLFDLGTWGDRIVAYGFEKTGDGINSVYSWHHRAEGDGYGVTLYPAGTEVVNYDGNILQSDITKVRIYTGFGSDPKNYVFYREGEAPTVAPSNPHPEILNGDLSAFAGTWASSSGIGVILRPDGIFATASNMHYWKEAGGFNRGADSFSGSWASNGIDYHWNIYDEEGRYIGIVLFPVGVGVRYGGTDLPSDTTRARIYSYQHDAYPANEYLYYRVGEAASQSQPQEPADLTGEWHYRSITGSCHGQEHYIFTADGYYRKGDFYQQHDGTWSLVRDTATGKYHLTLQYKHFIDFESGWSHNEFTDNSEYETIDPNNINLLFHGTVRKELTRCNNPGWNAQ